MNAPVSITERQYGYPVVRVRLFVRMFGGMAPKWRLIVKQLFDVAISLPRTQEIVEDHFDM